MATHLLAFSGAIDSATGTELPTLVDDVLTRSGTTRYLVPDQYNFIHWAAALGPNLTDARIRAPSLLVRRMDAVIVPRRRGANTFNPNALELYVPSNPIQLRPTEEIVAVGAEDGTGSTQVTVLVALGPSALPPTPVGDIRQIRFIGSTTLSAFNWTSVSVTPEQSLEPGTYVLVHFIPVSAGCIAARAIFPAGTFRPGMPGLSGTESVASDFDSAMLSQVGHYPMGSFTHLQLPIFQFLSSSADTTEVVHAWAVKVA